MSTLDRLRHETRAAHSDLETAVGIEGKVTNTPEYTRLLERFYGFYQPLEELLGTIGAWSAHGIDFHARRKTPWLKEDLLALQHTPESLAALPRCTVLPRVQTLANAFGCAYVLEGATLGGRQISHLLRGTAIPEEARHFFHSYGAEVGNRWREFTTALEAFGQDGIEDEIAEAARSTFTTLRSWLAMGEGGVA